MGPADAFAIVVGVGLVVVCVLGGVGYILRRDEKQ